MKVILKIVLSFILSLYTSLLCFGAIVWINATAFFFYGLSKFVLLLLGKNQYSSILFLLPFNTFEQWKKYISIIASFIKESSFAETQSMLYYKFKRLNFKPEMSLPYFKFPSVNSNKYFYDSVDFTELSHLLIQKDNIKNEYIENVQLLKPYINESGNMHNDWNTIMLYGSGELNTKISINFPVTMQCLNSIKDLETSMILFSVLKPGAHIPSHTGPFNAFLRVHLPLILPKESEKCIIKVGTEYKYWKENELLIFDDSFEHTVNNNTDETRVILMLSVWKNDVSETLKKNIIEFISLLNSSHPFKKWMQDNS